MFIVKKNIKGKDYYYLRESKREGEKVVAKTLAYLGKTKKEAEEKFKKIRKERENMEKRGKKEEKKKEIKPEAQEKKEIKKLTIDELATFCKRKGFVFQSSLIYGGMAGMWDFGPLGVELFEIIKQNWWEFFVRQKENITGINASILSHPKIWKASGHEQSFSDIFVRCKKCKKSDKIDKSEKGKAKCECGGEYEVIGDFNLMFKTSVGTDSFSYLRPETAQGMFTNFKLVEETSRKKLPFGIAQIGKCFRNEIAPRDFLFRSREFTIAELEFFVHPEDKTCNLLSKEHLNLKLNLLDAETQEKQGTGQGELKETTIKKMLEEKRFEEWHAYWLAEQLLWFKSIGLDIEKLKIREHMKTELSHYSSATFDIDYEYPFGSKEIAGNANRTQYDLTQHMKESGESLEVYDEDTKQKIIPSVIEPTFGIDRVFLALLCKAYTYDVSRDNIVLKLPLKLAPIKVAILPIVRVEKKIVKIARQIYEELKKDFFCVYDEAGSLGRRYARQDEIGTPFTITIDNLSLKDKAVTIRNRDDTKQIRVKIDKLKETLRNLIEGEVGFEKAGKIVETRVKGF